MRILDLFCGAGGLSYGFEQAGFEPVLGVDFNAQALETYQKNHKNSQILCGNLTSQELKQQIIDFAKQHQIQGILGGPPCQGFSLKGKKLGLEDKSAKTFSKIKLKKDFASLSLSAINKILPYIKEGLLYSHAVFMANIEKVVDEHIWKDVKERAIIQNEISKIIIKKDKEKILKEVEEGIHLLFNNTCYKLDKINVEFYDEETLYIEFLGEDSALLIGKEGYRYKALSYILFNWINEKYGLMLRLEVAQFLKNQEEAIYTYLEPIIEIIKEKGTFKTKPLDGILVHIALKRLREEFPDKYVAVKTNVRGDKYVLINEYRAREI